jgi:hypothetical protein
MVLFYTHTKFLKIREIAAVKIRWMRLEW